MFGSEAGGSHSAPIDVDQGHDRRDLADPSALEPPSGIEPNPDPISDCVASVLEIVPDVEPDHLTSLVTGTISTYGAGVLEHVVHVLLEDPKYPKIDKNGKGKRKPDDENIDTQAGSSKRPKVDYGYGDMSRISMGGPDYSDLALVRHIKLMFVYVLTRHRDIYKKTSLLSRRHI